MKKNKGLTFVGLLLGFLFLIGCDNQKEDKRSKETSPINQTTEISEKAAPCHYTDTPTLFVHGYQGGNSSFKRMLKRFEKEDVAQHEVTLVVDSDGNVSEKGKLSGEATNPMIQVLFEDNVSHEWNQALWLDNCLTYLSENYQVERVNIVGHSMGGVSALRYLMTYSQNSSVKVEKFVAIGSPFNNFAELAEGETVETILNNGPINQSERYQDFVTMLPQLPQDLDAYLIAGDVGDGSDGTVSVSDALSVYSLLKQQLKSVDYQVMTGNQAQHSALHENKEVDQVIETFLYEETTR